MATDQQIFAEAVEKCISKTTSQLWIVKLRTYDTANAQAKVLHVLKYFIIFEWTCFIKRILLHFPVSIDFVIAEVLTNFTRKNPYVYF